MQNVQVWKSGSTKLEALYINHKPEHKQLEHFNGQCNLDFLQFALISININKTTTIKYSIIESDEFFSHDLIKKQTTWITCSDETDDHAQACVSGIGGLMGME